MTERRLVLVLGGTSDARALAALLDGTDGVRVVSSLAGRTKAPVLPAGESRIGGFGGVDGLAAWLRENRAAAVVDATHPFAARISANAVAACEAARVPLLRLDRPGWTERDGDDWRRVPSAHEAAALLPGIGRRVFLTTGRLETAPYARLDDLWFLLRSVEAPEGDVPRNLELLLDRGPFAFDDEVALMSRHRIDVVVTKDSGGTQTAAKLDAARELGLPVVMISRPACTAPERVASAAHASAWARDRLGLGTAHVDTSAGSPAGSPADSAAESGAGAPVDFPTDSAAASPVGSPDDAHAGSHAGYLRGV